MVVGVGWSSVLFLFLLINFFYFILSYIFIHLFTYLLDGDGVGGWESSCHYEYLFIGINNSVYIYLNKRLSKQSRCRWFETPSLSLLRHCDGVIYGVLPAVFQHECYVPNDFSLYLLHAFIIVYQHFWVTLSAVKLTIYTYITCSVIILQLIKDICSDAVQGLRQRCALGEFSSCKWSIVIYLHVTWL